MRSILLSFAGSLAYTAATYAPRDEPIRRTGRSSGKASIVSRNRRTAFVTVSDDVFDIASPSRSSGMRLGVSSGTFSAPRTSFRYMHANESSGGDMRLWQNTYAYAFGSPPYWLAGSIASSSGPAVSSSVASPEPVRTSSENVPGPSELGSPNFQPLARGKLPAFQLAIQSSAFSRPSPAAVEPSLFFSRFGSSDPADAASSGDARTQLGRREGGAAPSAERAPRAGAATRTVTHAGARDTVAAIME